MKMVWKGVGLRIVISVCALAWFGSVAAGPCPTHVTADNWPKVFDDGPKARRDFLSQLKTCLPGRPDMQQEVDDLAVDSLDTLGAMARDEQKPLADFAVQAFRIDAEAGFASSQHNYAAVHNARPGSLIQRLVPQDYPTFIYWTRKAAAQKEPRALFNLAVRMADDKPPAGVARDFATAYTILTYLARTYDVKGYNLPPGMMTYIKQGRAKLARKLGRKEVRKLTTNVSTFDFSKLSPPITPSSKSGGRHKRGVV